MSEINYDINNLPEGKLLYEESSVRSVSEAIRAITGRNEKYSHVEQAEAISNIKNYIYPFFMIGPGSGGIGCGDLWGHMDNKYQPGPVFPNILYNFKKTGKNLNIVFKISKPNNDQIFMAKVQVGQHRFVAYEANDDTMRIYVDKFNGSSWVNIGDYSYNDNSECKIHVDTYLQNIYMYIDDVVALNGSSMSNDEFLKNDYEVRNNTSSDGTGYFDLVFPSYATNPGSDNWHTCEIKYLRLEAEDQE